MLYDAVDGVPEVNQFIQHVLFFFSALCWLFGFGLVGIGIYACIEKEVSLSSIEHILTDPAIITLCFGAAVFFITFFACVGALRQNVCMLNFFSIVICVSLVLQLVSIFVGLALTDDVEKLVINYLSMMIVSYRDDLDRQNLVDWSQEYFQCCGLTDYKDWEKNIYFNCSNANPSMEKCSVPWSCCKHENETGILNTLCGIGVMKLDNVDRDDVIYDVGCVDALVSFIHDHLFVITCVGFAMAVPQMVGVLLARMLVLQVKDAALYISLQERLASGNPRPVVYEETEFFV